MKQYSDYTVEDFIVDEKFQHWVKRPDYQSDLFWTGWLMENPGKGEIVEEAKKFILKLHFKTSEVSEERISNLRNNYKRAIKETTASRVEADEKRIIDYAFWYKIAAAFLLVIAATLVFYVINNTSGTVKHYTAYGETKSISLPDGSTVTLNGNSSVSYAKNWKEGGVREVYLKGEAFFSVVHKKNDEKFLVKVSDMTVQVLGTKFDVKQRNKETRVVLNSGKVQLLLKEPYIDQQVITMAPGDLVDVNKETKSIERKIVNPEVYSSWRNKKLVLDNTSLEHILEALEDDYGVKVEITDTTLLNQKVFGSIPSHNLDTLLVNLSHIFRIEIKKDKNEIKIK